MGNKQQQAGFRCQSLFPHALFINLYAPMARRSIWISFLCIHQSILLIHNPQFQEIRVRALGDGDQTSYPSKGSSGPSTAQSHDPSTLIAETRCAPLTRPFTSHFTAQPLERRHRIYIASHQMINPSPTLVIDPHMQNGGIQTNTTSTKSHYLLPMQH